MGDTLVDVDVREVLDFHKVHGALATLGLMRVADRVADTSQYRVVELTSEQNIVGFQEKPDPATAMSDLAHPTKYAKWQMRRGSSFLNIRELNV